MKVLLIDVNCKSGSTGKIAYDLYSFINSSGNEAAVCYGRGSKIEEDNVFKFGIDLETKAHAFLTRLTGYTGTFSPFSTRRLINFIKKFKPDVVHIHELHAYFVNVKPVLRFLADNNIKTVYTLHCEFMYTGKCGLARECEQWKTECKKCPHLKYYPSTYFFDHTAKMFKDKKKYNDKIQNLSVVTPSRWLAERCKQSFLGNRDIRVIHNGIDTNTFRIRNAEELRVKHNIADGQKVVLSVAPGIMGANKGGRHVLSLAAKMADDNVKFILIGADEPVDNVAPNVEVLSRIYDRELLARYYSLADVFVICSERENFPTTCLEAQCCGAVVCGFDAGGVKETLIFEPDGSCVEYGNIDALAALVKKRLSSGIDKRFISERAHAEYDASHMCEQYYELYQSMIEKG